MRQVIDRVIKWRMRWAGHVASRGRGEVHTNFGGENLVERDHLKELGVGGRIILRRIFRKWDGMAWTGLIWFRIGTVGGHL